MLTPGDIIGRMVDLGIEIRDLPREGQLASASMWCARVAAKCCSEEEYAEAAMWVAYGVRCQAEIAAHLVRTRAERHAAEPTPPDCL